ncbi:MAG: ATP-binding protein [Erysipelotrichaceae bacterium]|nr:ATP-binding protein [Erysipelotrichaceae bacterium]
MVGREYEKDIIDRCLNSNRAEFLVVYGRRRVGKTYLIKEYFHEMFSFYATGIYNNSTKDQLKRFNQSLIRYGYEGKNRPKDWYEAFDRLEELLESDKVYRDSYSGKRVIFLDELPWMDTAKSGFRSALDSFWNSYASGKKDILLIGCGSATSWIINNLLKDKGGFYNRVTMRIHLNPFTLKECEEYFKVNNIDLPRDQIIETYMVFGGIPFYLNMYDKRYSLAQNIDSLLFNPNGQLYYEYENLLSSLFKNHQVHASIIEVLSRKRNGMTRGEIAENAFPGKGKTLTKALSELEQCGFIRKYNDYTTRKYGSIYQIIDPFMSFSIRFLKDREHESWLNYIDTPSYYSWMGLSFEQVCLLHTDQIKRKLGISGVESSQYAFKSKTSDPGAQIDLLIDRKDNVINICEDKFTKKPFEVDKEYYDNLINKKETFIKETKCRKAVRMTLVSASGLHNNAYSGIFTNVVNGDDLFE